ncbi:MAG TPA: hypothetical protein PLY30_00490, partial [Candidatus Omnitrophota bacterium]|nr:hypothetical protein [Candidatus Omnitrophota bacterium]
GIILAFILSLAAAGGAYFLYQNLGAERSARLDLEEKYDASKERVLTLQSEKEQIKAAKEQFEAESEEYQRKAQTFESQVSQLKKQSSQIADAKVTLEEQLREKEEKLAAMEKRITELQRQAEEAMKACKVTPSDVKATLSGMTAPGTGTTHGGLVFSSPEAAGGSTSSVVAAPAAVTPSVGISSAPAVSSVPASAPVDLSRGTRILTVNRKFNFVVVNMGLKDGLKMGDQLKVVKGGVPSATLQIEKLYDKFAAATILNENAQNQVAEGDEVRKF